MRIAPQVELDADQRSRLEAIVRSRKLPARLIERSRIVLLAAAGCRNNRAAGCRRLPQQTDHCRVESYSGEGGAVAEKIPPTRTRRSGKGRPSSRPQTADHRETREGTHRQDHAANSAQRYSLEHPLDGRRHGNQCSQRAAYLARTRLEAAPHRHLQAQQRSPLCRETRGRCRAVSESTRTRPGPDSGWGPIRATPR